MARLFLNERPTPVVQEPRGCAAWNVAFGLTGDVLSDNPPSSVDHGLEALLGCADAEGVGRSLLGDVSDGQGLSAEEDEEDDFPTLSTSSGLPSADEPKDKEDAADDRAQQQGETTAASTSTSASSSSFSATTTALSTSSARSSSSAAPSVSSSSLAPVPPCGNRALRIRKIPRRAGGSSKCVCTVGRKHCIGDDL